MSIYVPPMQRESRGILPGGSDGIAFRIVTRRGTLIYSIVAPKLGFGIHEFRRADHADVQ
jgi:hypothetical protein